MSEQIAIRIPDELAESLAELVGRGVFETKAEAIRTALEGLVETERRRRVGELIVKGYERVPQGETEELAGTTRTTLKELEADEAEAGLAW